MRRNLISLAVGAALLFAFSPVTARADDATASETSGNAQSALRARGALLDAGHFQRPSMISFFAFVPYAYGVGVGIGARYTLPLLHDGFIDKLNDSIELEFGADAYYATWGFGGYFGIGIPAEARWTFHITDKFDAYGKVGVGWVFYAGSTLYGFGAFYPQAGPGVLYKFTDTMYLRAEVGYGGLRAGLGMTF